MYLSDQEQQLARFQDRHNELRRQAEHDKLVRLAKRAARDQRAHNSADSEPRSELVNRLFSLFF